MDYRQKIIVKNSQTYKHEEDDDEDLETLRLAALKSLKAKTSGTNIIATSIIQQPTISQTHLPYNGQKLGGIGRREYYYPNRSLRPNGNVYYSSRNNQNLIEIIPVQEDTDCFENDTIQRKSNSDQLSSEKKDESKFHRYADNASGTDDEDTREPKDSNNLKLKNKIEDNRSDDDVINKENQSTIEDNNISRTAQSKGSLEEDDDEEEEEEDKDDDDDDVLLMADLEEEDSLERLMDEMEREMTEDKPTSVKKEKKCSKKDNIKESNNRSHESVKLRGNKFHERSNERIENIPMGSYKNDRRSSSPYGVNRTLSKHRSASPKLKSRKKSPRRSPQSRRSPRPLFRQIKKSQRDTRLRSPRKSPPKYSPRPRSPKLSSRSRSPRMSPVRSPPRKLSPRGRSQSRSPLRRRSRSPPPRLLSRSRSPRIIRPRSPRDSPSRTSPQSRSSFPRSPKNSPHRLSPRRLSPRRTSPLLSRMRSPKLSPPKRASPRARSPLCHSPHKSPWSSPRNSPRLSPKRRRSPLELSKKNRGRSATPDDTCHKRENVTSPELTRVKTKLSSSHKETMETTNDPVLEARKRKFESTRPIDPVNDNKKIKLCRKELSSTTKLFKIMERIVEMDSPTRNTREISENEYELPEAELCLDDNYDFDELEEHVSSESASANAVTICVEEPPVKIEKERVKKKKKKDKELYQVGKLKSGELPLSERIGKEKKCKKRKEINVESVKEDTDGALDDLVDEEADLRTELSRRRAERLNRTVPIQSARLLQSAFKGVVNEVVKNNAKVIQRHLAKAEEKSNSKGIRRVTVLHRALPDLDNSEDETIDSKVPVRFRLGVNKPAKETRESKCSRKSSKRQGRKVKHKSFLITNDIERSK
ncbi:hypothetical protein PV328_004250 [Microctonus aethiopoides]|uniref:Uncharacterized protein n=1 Tax=Microctonus aethiopoides TaxID=144406 RepID=A0AA39FA69_9HYME|nr:hypothetical protein PV328_004250 [Microctonus aethiopoides]